MFVPVATTTAIALPLTIFVPVNPILEISVKDTSLSLHTENFSTGLDSPVNEA